MGGANIMERVFSAIGHDDLDRGGAETAGSTRSGVAVATTTIAVAYLVTLVSLMTRNE